VATASAMAEIMGKIYSGGGRGLSSQRSLDVAVRALLLTGEAHVV
jgi:hypothetical protein